MENLGHRFQHLGQWWHDRTRPQKIIIVSGIAAVVLIILIIIVTTTVASHKPIVNICDHAACLEAGVRIERFVNFSEDPCANLTKFACGEEPQERLISLDELGQQLLIASYKEPSGKDDHQSVKAAKALFQACVYKPQIVQDETDTLKNVLKEAGGYPVLEGQNWNTSEDFDWVRATSILRKFGFEYNAFLDVDLTTDPGDEQKNIFQVWFPGQLYSSYGGPTTSTREMQEYYFALFGGSNNTFEFVKHFQEINEFQEDLINTSYPMNHPTPADKSNFTKYRVKDYQKLCGDSIINWLEFINSIVGPTAKLTSNDWVLFPRPVNCTNRLNVISNRTKSEQANFIMWRALLGLVPYSYFMDSIRFPEKEFLRKNRERFCLKQTQIRFEPDPVNVMLARKYVHPQQSRAIAEMFVAIKSELVEMLKHTAWIYNDEQCAALTKIQNINLTMAYLYDYFDKKILDNMIVDMIELKETPNFIELLGQANRNAQSVKFKQINQSLQMNFAFTEQNLYFPSYHHHINTLLLPLTVLDTMGFQYNLPRYANYAGFGNFIAYYLVDLISVRAHHRTAFQARVWSPHSLRKKAISLDERLLEGMVLSQMIVSQRLSYAAYDKWAKRNEEELKLKPIRQYTSRQAFWISSATAVCKHVTYDGFDLLFTNSSLVEIILDAAIQHNPNFIKDFSCPKMLPTDLSGVCSIV